MAVANAHDNPLIHWRDGIHIQGTPIWCDARRARDVCFVSCAHAISTSRHGQLIATAPTLALLDAQSYGSQLSVPYNRPFTLGTVRLELIRSGHGLGSASLLVNVGARRVLYAGMVNLHGGGLGGEADARQCDTLVIAATYGDARFAFAALDQVVAQVGAFVQDVTSAGGAAVLLVSSPSKAMDVATRLRDVLAGAAQPGIFAHRSYCEAVRRLRPTHPGLPRFKRWPGKLPAGHVLLWPAQKRDALPHPLPAASRVALVSGSALDRDVVEAVGADTALAWSNQADCDELIRYIDACGASQIFLTHRFAEPLARRLDGAGRRKVKRLCRVLGPPLQMDLFG